MITQKRLSNFYHQFATLINAGVSITPALRSLWESTGHIQFKRIIYGIRKKIEEGGTLTDAMSYYPNVFSTLQLRIVEIGEKTGKLGESLARIGDNLDRNYRIQAKLITGFLYPIFLVHAAIFIPAIPQLFLGSFSSFLKTVAMGIIPLYGFALIVLVIVKISNRNLGLKTFFQYTFGYVPVIGPLLKRLAIARFMWNLSVLHGAGEDIVRSIKLSAEACGSIPIANAVFNIIPDIERGGTLTEAFSKVRFFPNMIIEMLSAGEQSGKIDAMLDKIAEYYEEESDTIVKRILIFLPVLIYLVVAFYIASIIIRFYVGYFSQIDSLFEGF